MSAVCSLAACLPGKYKVGSNQARWLTNSQQAVVRSALAAVGSAAIDSRVPNLGLWRLFFAITGWRGYRLVGVTVRRLSRLSRLLLSAFLLSGLSLSFILGFLG